jgi:hypothetical protein
LNLKTPFNGFEELAATVTHSGSLNMTDQVCAMW